MIEEHAVIVAIPPDQKNHAVSQATVMLERKVACGICGQKRGCGNATWGKLLGHNAQGFNAENVINAKVGDHVIVAIEERALLSSIAFMYIAPMIGMLLGAMIANTFVSREIYVFLGAMIGLLLGFLAVKRYLIGAKQMGRAYDAKYQSKILRLDETNTVT